MTPEERKLISDLFDRLATLEAQPRDAEAGEAINAGLKRAPNAIYPLVQTVLLQDEALKRADARIRELEGQGGAASQPGAAPRPASVPLMRPRPSPWAQPQPAASVPPPAANYAPPQAQQPLAPQPQAQQPQSSGGSFLGTAAAAAAGAIGGALLMNSMRGMFGGDHKPSAFGGPELGGSGGGTPWNPGARNSDLAREAGVDDISRGGRTAAYDEGDASRRTGLFDTAQNDAADDAYAPGDDGEFDVGGDFGGDDTA
jgi:hypothetical protein